MRILQVAQKPQRRGAEMFAYDLSRQLRRLGHTVKQVYLYPSEGDGALPLFGEDECLNGNETHLSERSIGYNPGLLRRLTNSIGRFAPEIVQVNGARAVKYGALARKKPPATGWKLVYRNIGDPRRWTGWRHRLFYGRWVMPQIDGIVGVSQATLEAVMRLYDLRIPSVQLARAIDPQALLPSKSPAEVRAGLHTPRDAPVLLYVGSLTAEKRVDRLLRITRAARGRVPGLRLWIIGDGPLRLALEREADRIGLDGAALFAGVRQDVARYMQAADLLALTSETEGIPGVILEAGWMGLPTIAMNVGGVAECLRPEETGALIDDGDEGAFTEAVVRLLETSEERRRMGSNAHDWIAERFTIGPVADRYVEFYESLSSR